MNFVLVGGFLACFYVVFLFLKQEHQKEQEYAALQEQYLSSDALMVQSEAQVMLKNSRIKEAISRLIVASAMDPSNDFIRQDLAKAYAQDCMVNKESCAEAQLEYLQLIEKYPKDTELLEQRIELFASIGDSLNMSKDIELLQRLRIENLGN